MHRLEHGLKVVGTKQTQKAIDECLVEVLYVADDAQPEQIEQLIADAQSKHIDIVNIPTMIELGRACDVEVKTATAALIVNN